MSVRKSFIPRLSGREGMSLAGARQMSGKSARDLRKLAGPALIFVEAALAVGVGLAGAKAFWLIADPAGSVTKSRPLAEGPSATSPRPSVGGSDFARLVSDTPFNPTDESVETASVPQTQLNLVLRGVRAEEDDRAGMAIISVSGAPAKKYAPGENLLDGVTLDRVLPDRVIILKGGVAEALLMPSASGSLAVIEDAAKAPSTPLPAKSDETVVSPKKPVAQADLSGLGLEPVVQRDQLVGYRVTSPVSAKLISDAGIEAGDIVIELDGTPVGELNATDLSNRLSGQTPLRLRIERAGASLDRTLLPMGYKPQ